MSVICDIALDPDRERAYCEPVHVLGLRPIASFIIAAVLIVFALVAIGAGFDLVNGGYNTPPIQHPV
jgi:hypothetical protein